MLVAYFYLGITVPCYTTIYIVLVFSLHYTRYYTTYYSVYPLLYSYNIVVYTTPLLWYTTT
ncbi:hypothetical protein GGR58DRAFT_256805 [Xylaria digitata]|nr:hypothetical protein GGR58DRAFT_256805 [Xylaria digitata]